MLKEFGHEIWTAGGPAVGRILAWPAEKVLMAHGTPVEKDAPAFLRRAFGWLTA